MKKMIIAGIIIAAIILIIIFRKQIAKFFGIGKRISCNSNNFYVKLSDIGNDKLQVLHVWTNDKKYYKQEAVMVSGGIESEKEIIEITQQEFDNLCTTKFSPNRDIYPWYYETPRPTAGHKSSNPYSGARENPVASNSQRSVFGASMAGTIISRN